MAHGKQTNFIDNVSPRDGLVLDDDVILNADLISDMASSASFAKRYPSENEVVIGAGYTIRMEDDKKILYRNGIKCPPCKPEDVISDINEARGTATSRIGTSVSEKYGLHMSPDKSFQFYKRLRFDSSDQDRANNGSMADNINLDK